MGTYFALTDEITNLAERLDKKGLLGKLFQKARSKREEEKDVDPITTEEREDK